MNRPLVSVIMPVRNGERFLREAIESILGQDYPSLELIVVDGQSTDGTGSVVQSFGKIRYIRQEGRLGIGHAKNLGIAAAKGEFLSFISHDDLWPPHKLRTQIDYMVHHPDVQYSLTRVKFFLEPGCSVPRGFRPELLKDDYVGKMPETLVARKSLFDSIGGFNTELTYIEDVEWFARVARSQIPMGIVQEVLLHKRIHDGNASYDPSKMRDIKREIVQIVKKSIEHGRTRHTRDDEKQRR
ncbi:MAG: glycosyltransferase [Deltaproteobacteria bacterium]|nr:glycosyltransferase [Deltaproteobacteria bacterium]